MVQELLKLMPASAGVGVIAVLLAGATVGFIFWIMGARISRPVVTLSTVGLGAVGGLYLTHYLRWNVSGAGPAVLGATLLGVSGFVLHRMWIGIGLGVVLAFWTGVAIFLLLGDGRGLDWPRPNLDVVSMFNATWETLPRDVARVLPYGCGVALVCGVAASIIWDKPVLVVAWSGLGTTMLTLMTIAAVEAGRPQWISHIPPQAWLQIGGLLGLVAIGSLIQWKMGPVTTMSGSSTQRPSKPKPIVRDGAD